MRSAKPSRHWICYCHNILYLVHPHTCPLSLKLLFWISWLNGSIFILFVILTQNYYRNFSTKLIVLHLIYEFVSSSRNTLAFSNAIFFIFIVLRFFLLSAFTSIFYLVLNLVIFSKHFLLVCINQINLYILFKPFNFR